MFFYVAILTNYYDLDQKLYKKIYYKYSNDILVSLLFKNNCFIIGTHQIDNEIGIQKKENKL